MSGWREECLRRFKQTQEYEKYDREDLVEELIEKEQELQRKDNIINEFKKALKDHKEIKNKTNTKEYYIEVDEVLDKIKELENSGSDK